MFIKQLLQTLNISESCDKTSEQIMLQITENMMEMKNTSSLLDHREELNSLSEHMKECSIHLSKLTSTENLNKRLFSLASIYIHLGYSKATLHAKFPPIDPLSKKTLKRKYYREAKTMLESKSQCYVLQNKLYSNRGSTLHPYYFKIEEKIRELVEKNRKLEKYIAVRPTDIHYHTVVTVSNPPTKF